jgi:hypothetical protein
MATLLKVLIILSFLFRIIIEIVGVYNPEKDFLPIRKLTLNKNYESLINKDDYEITRTAKNFILYNEYLADNSFDRPSFRKDSLYKTALRNKYNIWLHVAGIKIYTGITSIDVKKINDLPREYFYWSSILIMILKTILSIISFSFFYKTLSFYYTTNWSLGFTFLFSLYPENFYVGLLNTIDCLIVPLLIIIAYHFIKEVKFDDNTIGRNMITLCALISVSCALKFHVMLLLLGVFGIYLLFILINRMYNKIKFVILFVVIIVITYIPVFVSNYLDFGSLFLSTQSGFNLYHGHNPYAQGSWLPSIWEKYEDQIIPMLRSNQRLPYLNEKEESDYYTKLAIDWVLENPVEEIKLVARKVAIFFLPHNFLHWRLNIFTLMVHLGAILFMIAIFKNYRQHEFDKWIIASIIITTLSINVLFFVEYRWRYYTDPFMFIGASLFYFPFLNRLTEKYFHV